MPASSHQCSFSQHSMLLLAWLVYIGEPAVRALCSANWALAPAAKVLLQHIALAHRDWLPSGAMPMGHVNEAQAVLHALIGERPCSMLHLVAQLSGLLAIPQSKVQRPWAAVGH